MVRVQKNQKPRGQKSEVGTKVGTCDGHARHHLPSVPPLFCFGSHGHKISKITLRLGFNFKKFLKLKFYRGIIFHGSSDKNQKPRGDGSERGG